MSDLPKIIIPRPGELREAVMRWLVQVDDHLTPEEPGETPDSAVS